MMNWYKHPDFQITNIAGKMDKSCFIAYGLGILTYASVKGHHVFKHPFILNKNVLTQWGKNENTFRLQELFITNCLINAILN